MQIIVVRVRFLVPIPLTSPRLGVPIVLGESEIVVQVQNLSASPRHELDNRVHELVLISTGLTDHRLRVLHLNKHPRALSVSIMVTLVHR